MNKECKFQFGQIVTVDGSIGVIVKTWDNNTYDVYIRSYNKINIYKEIGDGGY